MYDHKTIILVVVATIINSIVFGFIASNTKSNKTNNAYLLFLSFIVLYTIFDCLIIQAFPSKEAKDIIVNIQALFWMPLSILFLNFTYSFLKKKKDELFYLLTTSNFTVIFFSLFTDNILIGYKDFNLGTMAYTGPWFLPATFIGILPAAVYALYLIGKEGKVLNIFFKHNTKQIREGLPTQQLKILFYGSSICLLIAVSTNIFFDELFGYSGELHLASLSLSIQSLFLLPALIKYNFLNQPMETLGDELYLNSPDAVFITNKFGKIINLNKTARNFFHLKGRIIDTNINELFEENFNFFSKQHSIETKTQKGDYVTIAINSINRGKQSLGKILVIRDISKQKKAEKAYKHVIETSSDIIYNTDINGIITFINPVFQKISGYKEKELVGIDINQLVAPDYQKKIKKIYLKFLRSDKGNLTAEIPCVKKNGNTIWLELKTSKIKSGKTITEFSTISRDITERKNTEYELQESEERYRLLVENSTEMIYKTDMEGNYTYVNQVFIKNSGISEAENLKCNCFDNVLKTYQKETKIFYKKQLQSKKLVSYFELPCYMGKNKIIWVGQYSKLELDEQGNPIGYSITARDITDRKQAVDKWLKTAKELTLAQKVAGLGSFTYSVDKDQVVWSDQLYIIYERDKKTFIPTRESFYNEIVHPDSKKMVIDKVDKAINNKSRSLDYVHKALMPNGKEKWFQAIIKIKYNKNNEATAMNGTSQDISELYITRLDLEESEIRLQKAQEIAKLGFWEENHKTGEIYWSEILKTMFGIKSKSTINKGDFWERVHPEDLEWMKTNWKNAEKNKTPYSGTFRIKLKKGVVKHLMEHAEFIKDSGGNLHKTVGTVIDMTELHQYQEELRKLSSHIQNAQEIERAHIAQEIHDELGQRLTSIVMDLSFLKSKVVKNTPEDVKERLIALTHQAENTIKIIRKISQELRPSILDDLGLIAAIDWLKEEYNKRTNIHFTMDMPKNDEEIIGEYATAIFRITQEALTNIIRHAEAKNVNIQIKLKNSEIVLNIQDDGKGIEEINKTRKEQTYGVFGMKERANSLGGKLIIGKNAKKGTSVNLTLPFKQKYKTAI